MAYILTTHKIKDKIHLENWGRRDRITLLQERTEVENWRTVCQLTCIIVCPLPQKPDFENLSWDGCAKPKWLIYKDVNKRQRVGEAPFNPLTRDVINHSVSHSPNVMSSVIQRHCSHPYWMTWKHKRRVYRKQHQIIILYISLASYTFRSMFYIIFTCIYNDMSTRMHSKLSIGIWSEMYIF